jgi:predicted MPP superfamily phosphohydrolase
MAILFSGDFHANAKGEMEYISKNTLLEKYKENLYKKINYHIMLGDTGFLWPENEIAETKNNINLAKRPFPILFVAGNHEPVLGRSDLPETDIGIGENVVLVNKEKPFIAYLKRGKIYNIEKYKFLVLGGALSIDQAYRTPGKSWWKEEYWSDEEKTAIHSLLENENYFDYVLSHTGPSRINRAINNVDDDYIPKIKDEVSALNEIIDEKITCKQWFCGHWHKDIFYNDKNTLKKYQYLYQQTALLDGDDIVVL